MKTATHWTGTLALLASLMAAPLSADEHAHAAEHEQHGAHEHGVATLSLATGEAGLEIMLESPAANLLGFEHTATSAADKQKLADVKLKLEAGADLFAINAEAGCALKDAEIVSALLENEGQPNDAPHAEAETHNDMDVTWAFACTQPAELKEVTVKLFSAFPDGVQTIRAEWVTDKGASARELTQDDTLQLN